MRLLDSFREGLRSILVNKLRSSLTMLGVIIGVAAVIAMVALGNGASESVTRSIKALGSNLITVTPQLQTQDTLRGAGVTSQSLTLEDMRAIEQQLGADILAIEAEQQAGRWQLVAAATNWNSSVTGRSASGRSRPGSSSTTHRSAPPRSSPSSAPPRRTLCSARTIPSVRGCSFARPRRRDALGY